MKTKPFLKSTLSALAVCLCLCAPVTAQQTDTTPPTITGVSFFPDPVDVTAGSQMTTVSIDVTDDLSGVSWAYCWLSSPPPPAYSLQQIWVSFSFSGDPLSGTLTGNALIPRYAASGPWGFSDLEIFDNAGNFTVLDSSQVADLGFQSTFEVQSDQDITAPTIVSVKLEPFSDTNPAQAKIDTSDSEFGEIVTVTIHVMDDVSGVGPEGYPFSDVDGRFNVYLYQDGRPDGSYSYVYASGFQRIPNPDGSGDGTQFDAYWQGQFTMENHSSDGIWHLVYDIKDNAGNTTSTFAPPTSEDFMSEVEVVSDPTDKQGATISSISVSPASIETATQSRDVTMTIDVHDNLSGVWFFWVRMVSPSLSPNTPGQSRWFYFSSSTFPTSATLSSTVTFPQYSEHGTWKVYEVYTVDRANNSRYWHKVYTGIPEELQASLNVILPSLDEDGSVDPDSTDPTTVTDLDGITEITIPAGVVTQPTTVAIDVIADPLDIPLPSGFSGEDTLYVNFHLDPEPVFPLGPPGLTVTLPLARQLTPGRTLSLFRINETTGLLEPSISVYGGQVVGVVNADGQSATFTGISRLSTVIALLPDPVISWNDPASIVYGTPLSGAQLNATATLEGGPISGSFSYTPGLGVVLGAGDDQPLSVTFTPADSDYRKVEKSVKIDVLRKKLVIKADNKTMVEGTTVPTLTASFDGFVNGDTPNSLNPKPSFSTSATSSSPPGGYDILVGGADSPNYEICYIKGTLTITAAPKAALQSAGYTLISEVRVSRTVWDYTYKFKLKNNGNGKAKSVLATLSRKNPASNVTVIDNSAAFADIAAGQTGTSQDTFVIRVDRTSPLNTADLGWTVNYSEESGASKSITLPY